VNPGGGPGVGIDLVEIERVERALERRPRLASRLFSARELEYSRSRRRPGRHLAARIAAKEAAIKALAPARVPPLEVEVVSGEPPRLELHGRAAEEAGRRRVKLDLSLTHSRELAAAVVVARRSAAAALPRGTTGEP
jgi:holo-[acyl-carrier protein] synthase